MIRIELKCVTSLLLVSRCVIYAKSLESAARDVKKLFERELQKLKYQYPADMKSEQTGNLDKQF